VRISAYKDDIGYVGGGGLLPVVVHYNGMRQKSVLTADSVTGEIIIAGPYGLIREIGGRVEFFHMDTGKPFTEQDLQAFIQDV
jgi:hypothetical protein